MSTVMQALYYVLFIIFNSRFMWHRWRGMHIFLSGADIFLFQRSVSNSTVSSSGVMRPSMFNLIFCWVIKVTWELLKELERHVSAYAPCQQPCLKAEVQNCFYDLNLTASVYLCSKAASKSMVTRSLSQANDMVFFFSFFFFVCYFICLLIFWAIGSLLFCLLSSIPGHPLSPQNLQITHRNSPKQAGKKNSLWKSVRRKVLALFLAFTSVTVNFHNRCSSSLTY